MTLWQGILLGLVQGLTEFLPISSDGHLAVIGHVAGVHTPGVFVEVALHVATLGSILVVYGGRFWRLALGVLRRQPEALQNRLRLVPRRCARASLASRAMLKRPPRMS